MRFFNSLLFFLVFTHPLYAKPFTAADALSYIDAQLSKLENVSIPMDPKNPDWVKEQLQSMTKKDQYIRSEIENVAKKFQIEGEERGRYDRGVHLRWTTVDSMNTLYLKQILDHHEWITISTFGPKADQHAWLIVQHADLDWEFQTKMLSVIEKMVKAGESQRSHFPYLFDRVARAFNRPTKQKPQRFGTQGFCNSSGKWEPHEMEDPTRVNKFRAEYGLGTLEEYRSLFDCSSN